MTCPCGSSKKYKDCCAIAHSDISRVKTAEQLMRSRYTAFTMANGEYLMKSHHSTTRPIKDQKSIEAWAKSVNWIRLEILETTKGKQSDEEGTVSFKAFYFENGKVELIHEKSAFVKENGHWVYVGLAK
ncbi:YchJ family protein [Cellulophaga sp. Hel_I_12]|uniref:YchJ family protein n=1 Tax=Cellulophaga sp. Hel_I_12 TaxID=1249972 RepID=UPI000645C48D|nr:YchJ family metal-binding protein [Cellulophaga sp. Hel_I_12]